MAFSRLEFDCSGRRLVFKLILNVVLVVKFQFDVADGWTYMWPGTNGHKAIFISKKSNYGKKAHMDLGPTSNG